MNANQKYIYQYQISSDRSLHKNHALYNYDFKPASGLNERSFVVKYGGKDFSEINLLVIYLQKWSNVKDFEIKLIPVSDVGVIYSF